MTALTWRIRAPQQESSHGQRSAKKEQGSPQAEEGKGEDDRRQSLAEGRSARAGESEERLASRRAQVRDCAAIAGQREETVSCGRPAQSDWIEGGGFPPAPARRWKVTKFIVPRAAAGDSSPPSRWLRRWRVGRESGWRIDHSSNALSPDRTGLSNWLTSGLL